MKIKDGYIIREVAGSNIVVPIGDEQMSFGGIMTLNPVGAFIWKLLENGADPNYPKLGKEDTDLLPLPLATGYSIVDLNHTQNAVKIVEMLLEYGADPNVILRRGRTCLIDVVELEPKYYNEYHYEIVRLLVEYGTDISIKDQDGFTAYDYAVKYNRTELYDLLKP